MLRPITESILHLSYLVCISFDDPERVSSPLRSRGQKPYLSSQPNIHLGYETMVKTIYQNSIQTSCGDEPRNYCPLVYMPLIGSEIRLIRIRSCHQFRLATLELEHVDLNQAMKKYVAVSYAWGDPTSLVCITISGMSLRITKNLYEALSAIGQLQQNNLQQLWIWADAICINQSDIDEKSVQIPCMGDIYRAAFRVIIWLGFPNGRWKEIIPSVMKKSCVIGNFRLKDTKTPYPLLQELGQSSEVWEFSLAFMDILTQPWFRRTWVVQEFILGASPCFLLGGDLTDLDSLFCLLDSLFECLDEPLRRYIWTVGFTILNLIELRQYYKSHLVDSTCPINDFAHHLNFLLQCTSNRTSSMPHDKIYGLLGMANLIAIPPSLAPNYRLPYAEVFYQYAKFIIETTGDLTILFRENNGLSGVSSWVPDLRYRGLARRLQPSHAVRGSPRINSIGNLVTQGVSIGTITTSYTTKRESAGSLDLVRLHIFDETILKPSSRNRNVPPEIVFEEWVRSYILGKLSFGNIDDVQRDTATGKGMRNLQCDRILEACERVHFLLDDGRIGVNNQEQQRYAISQEGVSDVVCILKGSNYPSRLRPVAGGYVFMGSCGIIDQKVEPYDEEFFSGKRPEEFVLV